jgi:hypothetical protein
MFNKASVKHSLLIVMLTRPDNFGSLTEHLIIKSFEMVDYEISAFAEMTYGQVHLWLIFNKATRNGVNDV